MFYPVEVYSVVNGEYLKSRLSLIIQKVWWLNLKEDKEDGLCLNPPGPYLESGPAYLPDLLSYLSLPPMGCPSHPDLLLVPWTRQAWFCLKCFALVLPSPWNLFPSSLQDSLFLSSMSQPQNHLLTGAFLNSHRPQGVPCPYSFLILLFFFNVFLAFTSPGKYLMFAISLCLRLTTHYSVSLRGHIFATLSAPITVVPRIVSGTW